MNKFESLAEYANCVRISLDALRKRLLAPRGLRLYQLNVIKTLFLELLQRFDHAVVEGKHQALQRLML